MNIHDHGENDPIPFEMDASDAAAARFSRAVIQIHREQLNDKDKAQQMAANEREIAQWVTP